MIGLNRAAIKKNCCHGPPHSMRGLAETQGSVSRKHEQTQPGQTCWIESTGLSGYDIRSVQEHTKGCVPVPCSITFGLNRGKS